MWSLDKPHWVAGPLRYQTVDEGVRGARRVLVCRWEFIGGTATGDIKRWYLNFTLETRKFSTSRPVVHDWERGHWGDLGALYRPIAVLRCDLPQGGMAVALSAMLGDARRAELIALALRGGRLDG